MSNSAAEWEVVKTGVSGAQVARCNGVYRKLSDDPRHDLTGEAERLIWLRDHGIPAPKVLEYGPGRLFTAEVPGRSAAEDWPAHLRPAVIDAIADLARSLHASLISDCPFDRRLTVTIPEAQSAAVAEGSDAERACWDQSVAVLLATRPAEEDSVVCHGDLCLPNILLDPETCRVTGLIDAGRLGVSDRWNDLAIATRSMTDQVLNPQYGPWAADRFLARYGISSNRQKVAFYRLLDECS